MKVGNKLSKENRGNPEAVEGLLTVMLQGKVSRRVCCFLTFRYCGRWRLLAFLVLINPYNNQLRWGKKSV